MAAKKSEPQEELATASGSALADAEEAAAHISASAHLIGAEDASLAGFFTAFTRYASPEDLLLYSGAELATLVRAVYEEIAERPPHISLIKTIDLRARDKSFFRRETLLIAVNEDMPFLFDSCTAEVLGEGHRIRAAFHPVITSARDDAGRRAAQGVPVQESVIVLALEDIDETRAAALRDSLARVFGDVRRVVHDWKPMLWRMQESIDALAHQPPKIPTDELDESLAFLRWLADNHFTFLGARDYRFSSTNGGRLEPDLASGLGLLADPEARVIRRGADRTSLTPEVRTFLNEPSPLIITKSNSRSSVHRRVYMDYVGVKVFDAKGELTGERRFVGLFTSTAYSQLPTEIPLLRRKIAHVLAGSGLPHNSHDGKALAHILYTYPRDELFQITDDELLATALGILNLGQRPKVRVFLRFDTFDRFVSALVFVPRTRATTAVRDKIHALLAKTFDGRMSAAYPSLDLENLARIHFIVGRNPGVRPQADPRLLEEEIREIIRTWEDAFGDAVLTHFGEAAGAVLARRYAHAFSPSYRDSFSPAEAVDDVAEIETLLAGGAPGGKVSAHVIGFEPSGEDGVPRLRLKLFVRGDYIPLSDCLPVFENLGLKVIAEAAFPLYPLTASGEPERVTVQSFLMTRASGALGELAQIRPLLEDGFHAVWLGLAESDGFNQLILEAELSWRDVSVLRAVAKYLRQAGVTFSQPYMEAALAQNPQLAMLLIDLFYARHDPTAYGTAQPRENEAAAIGERIEGALESVPNADQDRIIRAFAAVIDAMLRTNFFQRDDKGELKKTLAFKLNSRSLDLLPAPKPFAEITVYSRDVEGVHLRFGRVARGGIRWSDRAEDFRTEILGLVKAQQVKNAVIVPVGAKGGFYPKLLPVGGSRDEIQAAAIAAYQSFIGALLDVTDNIAPDGATVPPADVLRRDGDDPYLVVAADKGTATFSDYANAIARARGFWLGDAFASGGSHGYDHKKLGITARGAWEAVKRHFRELGRDIQTETFTCIGVGDMSGDVFGNAMLQSKKTKLIAAFDHRHVFFDPDPNPDASWAERKRLFQLPRSSWDDYGKTLISKGGGVFPRSAKTILLSPAMRSLTGLEKDSATPQEVIRALLTAPCDLLFFGGIGTFVKASAQSHADVGDRSNDAVRVNGRDVRAHVIGEGANLGVTQLGRVEYARDGSEEHGGGGINTDAIDNSAGVDTSDHEVNLKILFSPAMRRGELSEEARDRILLAVKNDIAQLVLADNYDQTLAISVAEMTAAADLDASTRLIRELERSGKLDRAIENLPDEEGLRSLAREGRGLTRPEIAVLLAYAKLDLSAELIESKLPDDPYFDGLLRSYFPPTVVERFGAEIETHRLKREIVATQLVNRTVNLAGPLFAHRMRELSNAPLWCTLRAFALADGAFRLSELKTRICALDLKVKAQVQNAMMADIADLLRRLGLWFIVQLPATADIGQTVASYGAGVSALKGRFSGIVSPLESRQVESRIAKLRAAGVPTDVAEDAGVLPLLGAAPEIVLLAETQGVAIDAAAGAYFQMGAQVGFDRMRILATQVAAQDHWDRLALRRIFDDLYSTQRQLAAQALQPMRAALSQGDRRGGAEAVRAWTEPRAEDLRRMQGFIDELERAGTPTVAKMALANSQVQKLAAP